MEKTKDFFQKKIKNQSNNFYIQKKRELHQIDSKDNQKITIIKMERKVDVFKRNKKKAN